MLQRSLLTSLLLTCVATACSAANEKNSYNNAQGNTKSVMQADIMCLPEKQRYELSITKNYTEKTKEPLSKGDIEYRIQVNGEHSASSRITNQCQINDLTFITELALDQTYDRSCDTAHSGRQDCVLNSANRILVKQQMNLITEIHHYPLNRFFSPKIAYANNILEICTYGKKKELQCLQYKREQLSEAKVIGRISSSGTH